MPLLIILTAIGFASGFLLRLYLAWKARKKMLRIENEMLRNHSRILSLQQKIANLETKNELLAKR